MEIDRVIITAPYCVTCRSKKIRYEANGIPYREVEANSQEGQALINEYNIQSAGTVIDMINKKIVND